MSGTDLSVNTVAGTLAGLLSALVCSPLDVGKTRLQAQRGTPNPSKYSTITHTVSTVLQEEGIRGFYVGLGSGLLAVPVYWGIYFPCYQLLKGSDPSITHIATSAILAGLAADTVTNPLWVIRTRLLTSVLHHGEDTSIIHTTQRLYYSEGIRAFFKGLTPSLSSGIANNALQLPLYETFKTMLVKKEQSEPEAGQVVVAAALAKILAYSITYPVDVLRTRVQDDREKVKVRSKALHMLRKEGIRSLYAGFQFNLLRVIPQCTITFLTYETVKKFLVETD